MLPGTYVTKGDSDVKAETLRVQQILQQQQQRIGTASPPVVLIHVNMFLLRCVVHGILIRHLNSFVVHIKGVHKTYNGAESNNSTGCCRRHDPNAVRMSKPAVNGLSFAIESGQVFGLLGIIGFYTNI